MPRLTSSSAASLRARYSISMGAAPGMRQAADAIADGDAHTSTATGAMTSVPAASSSAVRSRRSPSLMKQRSPPARSGRVSVGSVT